MNFKDIKRLVDLVEESDISHLAIEQDGIKIEVKKERNSIPASTSVVIPTAAAAPAPYPANSKPEAAESKPAAKSDSDENLTKVTAQMVGTYYSSPNPEAAPYIKVGDRIKKGQVICIIEAMKLFNEIESEVNGVVERILVENSDPVEFGQTLFLVKSE